MFNQQQFAHLRQHLELSVLVPVPWISALPRLAQFRRAQREAPAAGVDYVLFWNLPRIGRALNGVLLLASLLLQRFPTLVLRRWDCMVGSWAYPDAAAVAAIGRLTGTPVVAKVHGSDINVFTRNPVRRWQVARALNRCRQVVAVSRALAERVEQIGVPSDRIRVIYNGVDPTLFAPASRSEARQTLGLPVNARVLLYVGNLLQSKGCHELVHAFARLRARDPKPLLLALVGDGADRPALEQLAADHGLSGSIYFAGRCAHDRLPAWFAASDVLCLPSHAEGVPNVVLEAMACGIPVVASRVGGIPEVLEDEAGLLVPPRDVARLTDALGEALARSWDPAAIVRLSRRFSWHTNVRQMLDVLEEATA
jgi:glycosyltransferase involved in cell wall biosynthesis